MARGTVITTYFRLLHLRCRPFHPDLTGSSLLPSLTFRWEDVILQAVPAVPTFLSGVFHAPRAIVRPSCLVLFSSSNGLGGWILTNGVSLPRGGLWTN